MVVESEDPRPDSSRGARTQWMNVLVYHLLITLVNLLNLPLEHGTYVPRRSTRLTLLTKRIDHLKLLKSGLDPDDPAAVRAYLVPLKHLLFEIRFLLEQEPDLRPNPDFAPELERVETLLYNAEGIDDFPEVARLSYRLSILLPYYEDPDALAARRAQADEYERLRPR